MVGGSLFFVLVAKKGEKDSHISSTFNLCNEQLVYNNYSTSLVVMHAVMA